MQSVTPNWLHEWFCFLQQMRRCSAPGSIQGPERIHRLPKRTNVLKIPAHCPLSKS